MSDTMNFDSMLSGNRREINRFKVTEGSHTFRILPPAGTDHKGVPSRQVQLHWGFTKKDGTQSPLLCSYPTEGSCPICDHVKQMEQLAERAKQQGNEEESKQITIDAGRIKVKRTYLLNAANKQGEVGILELTKTSIEALVELMKKYQNQYGKNPVGLTTGVWFVFSRSGKGFNTTYKVEYSKEFKEIDGEKLEKTDNSPLAQNIVDNYEKLAYDIHKMYAPIPKADLKKILDGAPVDEVVVRKPAGQQGAAPAAAVSTNAAVAAAKPAQAAAAPKAAAPAPAAQAPAPAAAPSEDLGDIMDILNSDT